MNLRRVVRPAFIALSFGGVYRHTWNRVDFLAPPVGERPDRTERRQVEVW